MLILRNATSSFPFFFQLVILSTFYTMFYLYILQSVSTGKLYIGQTNNLHDRLRRHNSNLNKATKNKGPWTLIHSLEFDSRASAFNLEQKLKSWKSSKAVLAWIDTQANGTSSILWFSTFFQGVSQPGSASRFRSGGSQVRIFLTPT